MQVIDIMSTPVRTVRPTTSVTVALKVLAEHRLSGLPVVDDAGAVVGIVTERDLLGGAIEPPLTRRRWQEDAVPREVGDVMTRDPHTVRPDADVADVARVFTTMSWKALPVVRDRGLVGVISGSDVVRAVSRDDGAVRRDVLRLWANAGHGDWRGRGRRRGRAGAGPTGPRGGGRGDPYGAVRRRRPARTARDGRPALTSGTFGTAVR